MNPRNLLFLIAYLAHLPMMVVYARRMWMSGHYQFFPLLMGVSLWLLYGRVAPLKNKGGNPRVSMTLLCANLLLLVVATVLYSSMLTIVSFLMLLAITVYDRTGKKGLIAGLPAILLMVFIIPLPGNLDQQLILKMQFIASQLAGWILDAFGQIHFREGVVLITEKKQFFTEEACSGIRSLFSSLAAIAAFGVIREYSFGRQLFNLVQTVLWVIVGNAIRIAAVVYLSDNWSETIVTGTTHEMFGLLVFWLIFLLALSTDFAIGTMLKEREEETPLDDEIELEAAPVGPSVQPWKTPVVYGLIAAFVLISLFSARLVFVRNFRDQVAQFGTSELISVEQQDLPPAINGWTVTNFDYKERNEASLLAPESYIWTLLKENKQVLISLDGPYPEYHNLDMCYSGLGWDTSYRDEYSEPAKTGLDGTIVDMTKADQTGLVLFSAYDRIGQLVVPVQGTFSLSRRQSDVMKNLKLAMGLTDSSPDTNSADHQLPISQIQLVYIASRELTDEDRAELKQLFLSVRERLLQTSRFRLAAGG